MEQVARNRRNPKWVRTPIAQNGFDDRRWSISRRSSVVVHRHSSSIFSSGLTDRQRS